MEFTVGSRAIEIKFEYMLMFTVNRELSSRDQWKHGLSIDKDEIQVGDLVFFGSRKHNIGHVGIVCEVKDDGEFKFIHSSCKYGVTINNSEDGYYARRYRGARRILEG